MITTFTCFKNEDKQGSQPDYRLSAQVDGVWVSVGAGWVKESEKGKFISFKLQDAYQDKPGFHLSVIKTAPLRVIEADGGGKGGASGGGGVPYPEEDNDPNSIPF